MTGIVSLQRAALLGPVATLLVVCSGTAAAQPTGPGPDLTLVDLEGHREVLGALPPSVFAPRVSPDGERIVFEAVTPESEPDRPRAGVWVAPLSDLHAARLLPAVSGPMNWAAMWTPDGQRLVFLVSGDEPDTLYWQAADGSGDSEHLIDARSAESWAGGGTQLTFLTLTGNRDYGISLLDVASRTAKTVIDLPGSAQHSSNVSPDGRWIAFASNETGRYEVWIAPLERPQERRRITGDGGGHPLWSPDGGTLYFDRDNRLYRIDVNTAMDAEPAGALPAPTALPISGFMQGEYRRQFDLMPDGRRFLMLFPPSGAD